MNNQEKVVVIGAGPGGYEAALVAAHLGAETTIVDQDGIGGAAVLTDCVPSKTLISTADTMAGLAAAADVGVHLTHDGQEARRTSVDLPEVNARVLALAAAQSDDIAGRLAEVGVTVVNGVGRLAGDRHVAAATATGAVVLEADVVLVATGAAPRVMPSARPDGDRILTWQQIYSLPDLPEHLIVVGSGVTGAELAQAYLGLGSAVTLVSSRDRVLPGRTPTPPR